MFKDTTCLILGAGASRPYGFPTSGELRSLLLRAHDSRAVFADLGFKEPDKAVSKLEKLMIECSLGREDKLTRFRTIFGESQRMSIDSFLHGLPPSTINEELKSIALNAIATIILMCEEQSRLDGNWYQWLLEFILRDGKQFPGARLFVVTFNYDRSLEQYLWRAFMRSFDLSPTEARTMLERIEFVHVYGSLGPLLFDTATDAVLFGNLDSAYTSAKNLQLAAPRLAPKTLSKVREILRMADRLVFLGFGFWRENIDVLFPSPGGRIFKKWQPAQLSSDDWFNKQIFASGFKLWRSVIEEVNSRIGHVQTTAVPFPQPLITWGAADENLWQFVTSRNLNGDLTE